jgi:hypothetical protein
MTAPRFVETIAHRFDIANQHIGRIVSDAPEHLVVGRCIGRREYQLETHLGVEAMTEGRRVDPRVLVDLRTPPAQVARQLIEPMTRSQRVRRPTSSTPSCSTRVARSTAGATHQVFQTPGRGLVRTEQMARALAALMVTFVVTGSSITGIGMPSADGDGEVDVLNECRAWMAGQRDSRDHDSWEALRSQVLARPDDWWDAIQACLRELSDRNRDSKRLLGLETPMTALVRVSDEWARRVGDTASKDSKVATVLEGALVLEDERFVELVGRGAVVDTWVRYERSDGDYGWDFWAVSAVIDLPLWKDREAAWSFILELVDAATDDVLPMVGIMPIEDWLYDDWGDGLRRIEAEAPHSPKFRRALRSIVAPTGVPAEAVAHIRELAGGSADEP